MATERMNRSWHRIRDRIKGMWSDAELNDTALKQARGNLRQMVTLIHERTGEPRKDIRRKIITVM